jgi:TolB-like protein/DNA-binding winged helix-turn-helix (wHTH) protein/Tfp pilus assembly protein PilF
VIYVTSDHSSNGPNARPEGAGAAWTVGSWRVDAGTGELRRGVATQRVEPKVAEVLVYLAQRSGQMVSREELLSAVWPGVVVGDDALTQAVIKLRKALGDDARRPAYIETLAKRGYRLIAPVARVAEADTGASVAPPPVVAAVGSAPSPAELGPRAAASPMRREPRRSALLAGAVAALILGTGLAVGVHRDWPWPIGGDNPPRATAETLPVVAVLPLGNQSGDPRREFFSDGVTDDIIHALGRYSGLRVISRNSVQQFKQREATPQIVRDELGARYVITGGVREGDGQVRISVELSDAQTARVLWSERFEREGKAVFEIQDSIVQSVVAALAIKVTKLESDRAATRPPSRLEAYDLVLLARSLEAKAQRAANRQGRALITKARELDPDYAMVYVVASELEVQRADLGWMEDPAQGLMLAERAARHALTIDDPGANARAHAMLARIHTFRGEHERALAESERARALNPSDLFIAEIRGQTLLWTGRGNEAVALLESALRLDPAGRNSPVRHVIVLAYFVAERYPEALAACERALADHPDLPLLHTLRAAILAQTGRLEDARQAAAEVRRLQPNFPVAEFGSRLADPAPRARLQEALRKAGL